MRAVLSDDAVRMRAPSGKGASKNVLPLMHISFEPVSEVYELIKQGHFL
jgi:hypothetical protein